ncbi:MAG: rhodanese-like domain-containing protein, partial [Bacteroidales bacterium]
MKTLRYFLILLAIPILFAACNQTDQTVYGSLDKMVESYAGRVSYITPEALHSSADEPASPMMIVDIREPEAFIEGHIPGAVNVPRGVLEFSADKLSNRREKIVVYGQDDDLAILAAVNLEKLKFQHVDVLRGGFEKWVENYSDQVEEGTGESAAAPAAKAPSGG